MFEVYLRVYYWKKIAREGRAPKLLIDGLLLDQVSELHLEFQLLVAVALRAARLLALLEHAHAHSRP